MSVWWLVNSKPSGLLQWKCESWCASSHRKVTLCTWYVFFSVGSRTLSVSILVLAGSRTLVNWYDCSGMKSHSVRWYACSSMMLHSVNWYACSSLNYFHMQFIYLSVSLGVIRPPGGESNQESPRNEAGVTYFPVWFVRCRLYTGFGGNHCISLFGDHRPRM
jgi:hypothetical protein